MVTESELYLFIDRGFDLDDFGKELGRIAGRFALRTLSLTLPSDGTEEFRDFACHWMSL